jgi:hypothetical protein
MVELPGKIEFVQVEVDGTRLLGYGWAEMTIDASSGTRGITIYLGTRAPLLAREFADKIVAKLNEEPPAHVASGETKETKNAGT